MKTQRLGSFTPSIPSIGLGVALGIGLLFSGGCSKRRQPQASAPTLIADGLPLPSAIAKDDPHLLKKLPTIGAAEALSLAQQYVAKEAWETSRHFIASVTYLEKGESSNASGEFEMLQGPCWRITYLPVELMIKGGEYYVFVYMDRRVGHQMGL